MFLYLPIINRQKLKATTMNFQNKNLYKFHLELEELKTSVFNFLFKSKIVDFYKNNGLRINTLMEKINEIQKEYFEFEAEGTPLARIKMNIQENSEPLPVLKEGKTMDMYNAAFDELMNRETTIVF